MRGRDLVHPLPLAAIVVLVVNDHVLKAAAWFPRALSGKLSDVAGLFFFPILLVAVARALANVRTRPAAIVAALATASVFAAIKLEPHANAVAAHVLGSCARDPSDLVALPMTALAALFLLRRELAGEGARWARTATMIAASLASVATSRHRGPACPVAPPSETQVPIDTLCAKTNGATIVTEGAAVSITLDLTPRAPGCSLGARGVAVDQTVRAGLTARSIGPAPAAVIDQMTRYQARVNLPYAARCEGMRLALLYENAIVELPIAKCGAP